MAKPPRNESKTNLINQHYSNMSIKTKISECISALLTMKVHQIQGEETSYKSALNEVRQNKIRSSMPEMPKTLFLKNDFRVSGTYRIIDAEDIWTYRRNDDDVEYEITNITPKDTRNWSPSFRTVMGQPKVPDYLFLLCDYRLAYTQRFISTRKSSKDDIVYRRKTN
jgi:hypothetical protein